MSHAFGTPKTIGFPFVNTTTTATTTTQNAQNTSGFQFGGGGDTKTPQQPKPGFAFNAFATPTPMAATSSTGTPAANALSFNLTPTTTTLNIPAPSFGLATATTKPTTAASIFTPPASAKTTSAAAAPPPMTGGFAFATPVKPSTATTSSPAFAFKPPTPSATTTPSTTGSAFNVSAPTQGFSLGTPAGTATTTTSAALSTLMTASTDSAIAPTGNLTFAQLEDAINKWTIDLEEQGKLFGNQAKQLNAWDRLLISNSEKILTLSNGIERVKQQQQQLDQELDFVLAQQKELEDLIVPLEKELNDLPATDLDRSQTYQMAENVDSQLKQMSDDLKEVIEHINESNKNEELLNPVTQIGKILNAHMNSLQWIDCNTSKISAYLEQISKMHDMNRRNHEMSLQKTYD